MSCSFFPLRVLMLIGLINGEWRKLGREQKEKENLRYIVINESKGKEQDKVWRLSFRNEHLLRFYMGEKVLLSSFLQRSRQKWNEILNIDQDKEQKGFKKKKDLTFSRRL